MAAAKKVKHELEAAQFPPGSDVGVYEAGAGGPVENKEPSGEKVGSAKVGDKGTLEFNLEPGDYIAAAELDPPEAPEAPEPEPEWRRVRFTVAKSD